MNYSIRTMLLLAAIMWLSVSLYAWTHFLHIADYIQVPAAASLCLVAFIHCLTPKIRRAFLAFLLVGGVSAAFMLLGSILDFGRLGLQPYIELCRTGFNITLTQDLGRMFILAPMTHAGMLLGCASGLVVCNISADSIVLIRSVVVKHLFHLLGMCIVMVLIRIVVRSGAFGSEAAVSSSVLTSPVMLMWLGMSLFSTIFILIEKDISNRFYRFSCSAVAELVTRLNDKSFSKRYRRID